MSWGLPDSHSASGYRGETDAKRVARMFQHYLILKALERVLDGEDRPMKALVLAGDGGDARMLRGMGWPVRDIICVDRDAASLDRVGRLIPGMDLRHGDIRSAINSLPPESVGCALLDFCGHPNRMVRSAIRLVAPRLQTTSYLSFTYLRGRESLQTQWIRDARDEVARHIRIVDEPILDANRMGVYRQWYSHLMAELVRHSRIASPFAFVRTTDIIHYHSGRSPMGIATIRLSPVDVDVAMQIVPVKEFKIKEWACGWLRESYRSANVVADIANVAPATIAAWWAHSTRGSYSPQASR